MTKRCSSAPNLGKKMAITARLLFQPLLPTTTNHHHCCLLPAYAAATALAAAGCGCCAQNPLTPPSNDALTAAAAAVPAVPAALLWALELSLPLLLQHLGCVTIRAKLHCSESAKSAAHPHSTQGSVRCCNACIARCASVLACLTL